MMKQKEMLRMLSASVVFMLAMPVWSADLTWDPGKTGSSDGAGTWLATDVWWDGSSHVTWNNTAPDNATIGNGGSGGAITLGTVTAGTVLFDNFSGTYTLTGVGGILTQNGGITIGANAGRVVFNGTSTTQISGPGGIIKNSSGQLVLGSNPSPDHSFTGDLIVNAGTVLVGGTSDARLGAGNLHLNGGVLDFYWTYTFARTLGGGAGEVQVTGDESGFSMNGSNGSTVRFNNSPSFTVVWGSTFFSPEVFVLQNPLSQNSSSLTFDNPLDLNGTNRTIRTARTTGSGQGSATMARTISNGGASSAGLVKVGNGTLILAGANTYDGTTTISEGVLRFNSAGAIGGTGRSVIAANGTIVAAGYAMNNAFLQRLQENTNTFTVALGATSSNDLDFSGSTGADLPHASLGTYGNVTYNGTLTPNNNIYRLGGSRISTERLTVSSPLVGANRSLVVNGNVRLTAQPTFGNVVTIAATGATLQLDFTGTNSVKQLFVGDTEQAVGLYGPDEIEIAQITGTGYLQVVGPDPAGTVMIVK